MAVFKAWIDSEEFRTDFGYSDRQAYEDWKIAKFIRYGCERVDAECDGAIRSILGTNEFPSGLTKFQEKTVMGAVRWAANHALKTGMDTWGRGTYAINLGQINLSQSNPDRPDYFPPQLRVSLANAGLYNKVITVNVSWG